MNPENLSHKTTKENSTANVINMCTDILPEMRQQNKDDYTTDIDAAAAVAAALSTAAATTSLRAQSYSARTRQLAVEHLHKQPRAVTSSSSQYNLALMQQQQQQGQGHRLSAPPRTSTSTTMLGTSTNDSDLCTSESGSERSLREYSPPLIEASSSSSPVDAQTTSSCDIRRDQQTVRPTSLPLVGRLNANTRQKLFSTLQQLSTSHPYRHSSHSSSSNIDNVNSCSGDQLLVTTSPLNLSQSSAVKSSSQSHPFIADSSEGTYVRSIASVVTNLQSCNS